MICGPRVRLPRRRTKKWCRPAKTAVASSRRVRPSIRLRGGTCARARAPGEGHGTPAVYQSLLCDPCGRYRAMLRAHTHCLFRPDIAPSTAAFCRPQPSWPHRHELGPVCSSPTRRPRGPTHRGQCAPLFRGARRGGACGRPPLASQRIPPPRPQVRGPVSAQTGISEARPASIVNRPADIIDQQSREPHPALTFEILFSFLAVSSSERASDSCYAQPVSAPHPMVGGCKRQCQGPSASPASRPAVRAAPRARPCLSRVLLFARRLAWLLVAARCLEGVASVLLPHPPALGWFTQPLVPFQGVTSGRLAVSPAAPLGAALGRRMSAPSAAPRPGWAFGVPRPSPVVVPPRSVRFRAQLGPTSADVALHRPDEPSANTPLSAWSNAGHVKAGLTRCGPISNSMRQSRPIPA